MISYRRNLLAQIVLPTKLAWDGPEKRRPFAAVQLDRVNQTAAVVLAALAEAG
jgi:hypothetical protein